MIKFFRKIRQNLLMENKTGKYIKYAIGEIALVVIGILIALQINNWNSNRIEKQVELNQINLLIEDARADSVFFGTRAEFLSNVVSLHESILNMYESTLIDSISKLKKKENAFIFGARLANQSNVVVNNTNSLDIIKNDSIIKYLKKYYAKYEYVKAAIDLSNRMLEEHAILLYLKYPDELKASNSDSTLASYRSLIKYEDIRPNIELSQNFQQNSLNQVNEFNDLNALFIQKLETYLIQKKN